ncbi:hypothetical protein LTR09_006610 [Extremus antarcticus]|uniref:Uncharacterized protein n=1 Tax=Extremus antarcticus TaxID=702011 RepID=A0AAJ0G8K2_9PEZI|nr:hypothetical protein LTR09_006610 [Extremus antarcticus]
MSGTEETNHLTKEDIRKPQSKESNIHGGSVPANSEAAALQSIVDKADKNKASVITERQANLPLPDQPPVASDFNSADGRTVNVGSGDQPTQDLNYGGNDASKAGRQAADGLGGIPNDAVSQGNKNKQGLEDTTGKDYGYPQKNDPSGK